MPRFYFDIHDGKMALDQEGVDLPDAAAAIREVVRAIPAISAEMIPASGDRHHLSVLVRDAEGKAVYTAALSFCGTRL